jgi:hypothetical protein
VDVNVIINRTCSSTSMVIHIFCRSTVSLFMCCWLAIIISGNSQAVRIKRGWRGSLRRIIVRS